MFRAVRGERVGHWGGRYVWQLRDSQHLLVAWREAPDGDAASVETALITDFTATYGAKPFANRVHGRREQRNDTASRAFTRISGACGANTAT